MNSLYDGVYCMDLDRNIVFWNNAAEKLTGYSRDEVIGNSCANNILNHISEDGVCLCKEGCPAVKSMTDGQNREVLAYLHHKVGYRRPVYIRTSPIVDENENIIGAVEIFSSASMFVAMKQTNERLKKLAFLDELTELPNRRFANQTLEEFLWTFSNHNTKFGVAIYDIDNFKKINDTYGHDVGDQALKMVASTLKMAIRENDVICRWGGEEFLFICHCNSEKELLNICDRHRVFVENSFIDNKGEILTATISGGKCFVCEKTSINDSIKRADENLYTSKLSGKNQIH